MLFFQLYARGHSLCYGKREGEGLTDHGRAWERAARAIEKSANQNFDLTLDLQIKRSVEKEDNAWKEQIKSEQVKSRALSQEEQIRTRDSIRRRMKKPNFGTGN
jgi:hypothetical protein